MFRAQRAAALARGLGRPPRGAASGRGGGRGITGGRGRRALGSAAMAAQPSGSDDTAASSGSESPAEDAGGDDAMAADSDTDDRRGEFKMSLHRPVLALSPTSATAAARGDNSTNRQPGPEHVYVL
jgi:hypothetical protein